MSKRRRDRGPDQSAILGSDKRRVRFKPPGIDKNERTGIILETQVGGPFGTMYYLEDDQGYKYRLAPSAILAPEETDR